MKITFKFADNIAEKVIENPTVGDSILDITHDNNINLQHNCGGVCGCSTCHVYIENGMNSLPEIEDAEEDFIDRAIDPRINSRLACQCIIAENSEDITLTVPEQDFNGH